MEKMTLLQKATLVVGGTFVVTQGMQSIWNDRLIKRIAFAICLAGMVVGVGAIAMSVLKQMVELSSPKSQSTRTNSDNPTFSLVLKDGTVLAILSGVGLALL